MPRPNPKKPILRRIEGPVDDDAQDKAFVAMLSAGRMGKDAGDILAWLGSRRGEREKEAVIRAHDMRTDLSILAAGAPPNQIRALRVAYEAGQAFTEALAFQDASRRGPGSLDAEYDRTFAKVLSRWKKENPAQTRRPKWNSIRPLILQSFVSERQKSNGRGLQNRWQKWIRKTA
jgi:hypothetical protein